MKMQLYLHWLGLLVSWLEEIDRGGSEPLPITDDDNNMDVDNDNPLKAFVRMVVLDGLVFGPAVSS
jgi:hypothetical protein